MDLKRYNAAFQGLDGMQVDKLGEAGILNWEKSLIGVLSNVGGFSLKKKKVLNLKIKKMHTHPC